MVKILKKKKCETVIQSNSGKGNNDEIGIRSTNLIKVELKRNSGLKIPSAMFDESFPGHPLHILGLS